MDHEEENRLLQGVRDGDEAAFVALVRAIEQRIFRLAWRMTGDAALAEETTAEALYKVWTKSGQWRGEAAASTWIYRLAVRTVLDAQRTAKRRQERAPPAATPAMADPRPGPGELAAQADERQVRNSRIQAALLELTPADRALVHLYYYDERTLGEIAAILDVGREALKMRLSRARAKLRTILEFDDGGE